jgi:hypothetical protein
MCAAKTAIVVSTGKDRYGRTLGWVLCDGSLGLQRASEPPQLQAAN